MKVQMRKSRRFETFKGFPFIKKDEEESNGDISSGPGRGSGNRPIPGTDQGKTEVAIGYILKEDPVMDFAREKFKEVAKEKPMYKPIYRKASSLTPRERAGLRYTLKHHANVYQALAESEKKE